MAYDGEEFHKDLKFLVETGWITMDAKISRIDNVNFCFQQSLVQKTAYELLIFQKRRDLHLKIADYYENTSLDYLPTMYNVLAHHYFYAEKYDNAGEKLFKIMLLLLFNHPKIIIIII